MKNQIRKDENSISEGMMRRMDWQRISEVLFWGVLFGGMFLFFTVVHPLYIYDMDDWSYIIQTRKAIPLWKNWNPTRVLPETLMPLTAEAGVRIFMPLVGNYIVNFQ